jgi:hypothetical protein
VSSLGERRRARDAGKLDQSIDYADRRIGRLVLLADVRAGLELAREAAAADIT